MHAGSRGFGVVLGDLLRLEFSRPRGTMFLHARRLSSSPAARLGIGQRIRTLPLARRAYSSSAGAGAAAESEVLWPIGVGATLFSGVLLGAFWLRNDNSIQRMHGWVQRLQRSGMTSDNVTVGWLARLGLAFAVTAIPAESLKVRQLRQGGLSTWGAMLEAYDHEQQQIALGALCALLDGDAALAAFWEQSEWFDDLVHSLVPLVNDQSDALTIPEILFDALDVGNAIVSHPSTRACRMRSRTRVRCPRPRNRLRKCCARSS